MRYAAVTLLIAVLAASAVRAQSPDRENRSPSSQPKGQGPEVYEVKPQPDSPLRLSLTTKWVDRWENNKWVPDSRGYELATSVKNVSDRDVSVYAIRHTPAGERPEICTRAPPRQVLRPGQTDVTSTWRGFSPSDSVLTYEVDWVVFKDGTTWGADVCQSAERLAGQRAGGRAAAGRLMELLATGGPDVVMNAVKEELARSADAVLKGVDERLSYVAPPPGHSPVWELGFRLGRRAIAERVRQAVAESGPGEIEPTLRRPYDVAGAK